MCQGDTFCRCDLEEADRRRRIERAVELLKEEGYEVEEPSCTADYRTYAGEMVSYHECDLKRGHSGNHIHNFGDSVNAKLEWERK